MVGRAFNGWSGIVLVLPIESLFLDFVEKADGEQAEKQHHRTEDEVGVLRQLFFVNDRPRIQKNYLDVEEDEEHGHEVEFDGKSSAPFSDGKHAAFVGSVFGSVAAASFSKDHRCEQSAGGSEDDDKAEDEDGNVFFQLRIHE